MVINHESINVDDIRRWLWAWMPEILIVDESHRFKGYETAIRSKYLIGLSKGQLMGKKKITTRKGKEKQVMTILGRKPHGPKYRVIMTGTPILKDPTDIWAQMHILDPNIFHPDYWTFKNIVMKDGNAGRRWRDEKKKFPKWEPQMGAHEYINKIIYQHGMRVKKENVLDLPPFIKQRVDVHLTAEQERHYKQMKKEMVTYINNNRDEPMIAQIALSKALRLSQICCGVMVDAMSGKVSKVAQNRTQTLSELLEGIGTENKTIIWTNFATTYPDIQKLLTDLGIKYGQIIGGQSNEDRVMAMDIFNDPDSEMRVMLANQQAGGVGINLTQASYAIYYSRGNRLEDDLQSEASNDHFGEEATWP